MDKLISLLTDQFSKILIITLAVSTLATTGMGAKKIIDEVSGQDTIQEVSAQDESSLDNSTSDVFSSENLKGTSGSSSVSPTLSPIDNAQLSPTFSPVNQIQTDKTTGCIVTLFGKQYDVTSLRSSHSGGDIFQCGTDMTSVYQSQHGTDVSRMSKYLVTNQTQSNGTANNSISPIPSITSTPQKQYEDEHDDYEESYDEEHEDELVKKAFEKQKEKEHNEQELHDDD